VVTVDDWGRWRVITGGQTYDLSPKFQPPISPIIPVATMVELVPDTMSSDDFEIVVYDVDLFPRTHQLESH